MLKKTITYKDFNGNELTEDFYFNLSKLELQELQMSVDGGMSEYLGSLVPENIDEEGTFKIDATTREIWNAFKLLVDASYGIKSEDGKRFIKSDKILEEFKQTNAYVNLIMELAENSEEAEKFITSAVS
jgi:hypothetical protein